MQSPLRDLSLLSIASRLTPTRMRPSAKSILDYSERVLERVASTIQKDRIPTPPARFRSMVHGEPVGAKDHARIGQELFCLLREHCGLKPSSVVLDIGCGCGRVATPLARYLSDGTYHGVDIVKPMVDWCKRNISTRVPNFHFHHADLSNTGYRSGAGRSAASYVFPFSDRTFDVIFATSVFTHLVPESANQYAREVARLLRPGTGRAFLTFYLTNEGYRQRRDTLSCKFPHQCDGYSVYDRANLEFGVAYEEADAFAMLRNAGLSVENFSLGQWSKNPGWTFQDAFVVSRAC